MAFLVIFMQKVLHVLKSYADLVHLSFRKSKMFMDSSYEEPHASTRCLVVADSSHRSGMRQEWAPMECDKLTASFLEFQREWDGTITRSPAHGKIR